MPNKKEPKPESDLTGDPWEDKESHQKSLAPKKRAVPSKHNVRRKEDSAKKPMKSGKGTSSPGGAVRPH